MNILILYNIINPPEKVQSTVCLGLLGSTQVDAAGNAWLAGSTRGDFDGHLASGAGAGPSQTTPMDCGNGL